MAEVLLFNRALANEIKIGNSFTNQVAGWVVGEFSCIGWAYLISSDFDLLSFADPTNGGDLPSTTIIMRNSFT